MGKSELQQEYKRQRHNLQNRLYRLRKEGYLLSDNLVPEIPSTITQESIEELKRITSQVVKGKSDYLDKDTGEVISPHTTQELGFEKADHSPFDGYLPDGGNIIYNNVLSEFISKLEEPSNEYEQELHRFVNKLEEPAPPYGYNSYSGKKFIRPGFVQQRSDEAKEYLLQIVRSQVEQYGESAVGWRLQDNSDIVQFLLDRVLYGSSIDAINTACVKLASVITGGVLTDTQLKALGEQSEYNEDYEEPQ